jgi:hypothetical protein
MWVNYLYLAGSIAFLLGSIGSVLINPGFVPAYVYMVGSSYFILGTLIKIRSEKEE